ncbi:MAG: tyrosine-protein phosphatase [Deltaproteobacteria bacterium]|nr:tyrosine-protein phosphatase [Deltaproteobacteria bacterium]
MALEGCLNFRDLGGYPTREGRHLRWRRLYRSDSLHHLTAADARHLTERLGVGVIIDLRSTHELDTEGRGPLAGPDRHFHHLPLIDADVSQSSSLGDEIPLADRYFLLARLAVGPLVRACTVLAETEHSAVFYCAAGKDRTGILAALVLALLGVDDDTIAADYALTRTALGAIVERLARSRGYRAMLAALPPDTMSAEPATIVGFLARVREHCGDVETFLAEGGLAAGVTSRLRARLLEEP